MPKGKFSRYYTPGLIKEMGHYV